MELAGLGLKCLSEFNVALLSKSMWSYNDNCMWTHVVKEKLVNAWHVSRALSKIPIVGQQAFNRRLIVELLGMQMKPTKNTGQNIVGQRAPLYNKDMGCVKVVRYQTLLLKVVIQLFQKGLSILLQYLSVCNIKLLLVYSS